GRALAAGGAGGGPDRQYFPGRHADQRNDALFRPEADCHFPGGRAGRSLDDHHGHGLHSPPVRQHSLHAWLKRMLSFSEAAVQAALGSLLWPFVRALAMISTAPVFGHRAIPARVKVVLSLLIALLIAPSLPSVPVDAFSLNGLLLLLQQILVGACMGFGLRAIFASFEVAGDLIGLQMGLGFASFLDPARGTPSPLLATCFVMLANLVFMATDGHLNLLFMLAESFTLIPVAAQPLAGLDWMQLAGLGAV